ncbi:MAG TPA: CsbD family protein, partial [Solirubrobacterales bacterium]|nr:CsbD family protein [Solirubrobacterales bacterium]
ETGGFMTDKNIDKAKGRVKEATGALTGDKRLKNEGRGDQAKGSAKNVVDKVAETLTGRRRTKR